MGRAFCVESLMWITGPCNFHHCYLVSYNLYNVYTMYKFLYLLHMNGFWESLETFSENVLQKNFIINYIGTNL